MKKRLTTSVVPLPTELASLHTVTADPWVQINPPWILEGPSFDRKGNLYLCLLGFGLPDASGGKILKVSPDKMVTTVYEDSNLYFTSTAFHKDGRLFCCTITPQGLSQIVYMNPDGSNMTPVTASYDGKPYAADGMCFDTQGNLYVADVAGDINGPVGGVYKYSAPDYTKVTPILTNLAGANGISFADSGRGDGSGVLWVSETYPNRIIRVALTAAGTIQPSGIRMLNLSQGIAGPDGNTVDASGNLYQTMADQGRVVVLNPEGLFIANILAPGRDEGKLLMTYNLAFKPGTSEGYLVTSTFGSESWILRFQGLAKGATLFANQ